MLAVVRKPHTEITLSGAGANAVLEILRRNFAVEIVDADRDTVPVRETDWWKANRHRSLAGARHKAGLTQKQLAERTGIRQSSISEYERGKRSLSLKAATRLAKALGTTPDRLMP